MPSKVRDALRAMDEGWRPWWRKILDRVLPLPGPKELGKADCDALPSRMFGDQYPGIYTWEDWDEAMRRDYPIAQFLRERLPRPFRYYWRRITDAWYWIKCHTLPSYRFHMLDMRNPGGGVDYTHGWMDRSELMLWVCFKLLVDFVEKEQGATDLRECYTTEEIESSPELQAHIKMRDEIQALYQWWKTGRAEADAKTDAVFQTYHTAKTDPTKTPEEIAVLLDAWTDERKRTEGQDQEHLIRLIALREHLWT